MKTRKTIVLLLGLAALLTVNSSCKRDGISEPPVSGPSTVATILQLSANPNAMFASMYTRGLTTVTASLKKYDGTAVANRTIYFETVDGTGTRVDIGYFEGITNVASRATDNNGQIRLTYYGPLLTELAADTRVFIQATVAWQGMDSIINLAPVDIIVEATGLSFKFLALPDVLYVTSTTNQRSTLMATLWYGKSLAGVPVIFSIQNGPGYFSNNYRSTSVNTDSNGVATIEYISPLGEEISGDTSVTVRAQLTESNWLEIPLRIVKQR